MKEKYVVVGPGNDYISQIFSDVSHSEQGIVLKYPIKRVNRLLTALHHIHFSIALNSKIDLPFKNIWDNYYSIEQINFDPETTYYIIFTDISVCRYSIKYLKKLSEKENVVLGLTILNIMATKEQLLLKKTQLFDYVFSFDKKDSLKYNFIFWPLIYSTIKNYNVLKEQSAFFVGNAKKRLTLINEMFDKFETNQILSEFYVSNVPKNNQIYKNHPNFHYNQWLNYNQVLAKVRNSKYIVEIVDNDQDGLTLRSAEAIILNKKIITNNQSIKSLKFYNPEHMLVFENPSDIDLNFFSNDSYPDYQYDQSFSPLKIFEYMEKSLNRKGKS